MRLALAAYQNRIASLFETSDRFVFVEPPRQQKQEQDVVLIKENNLSSMLQTMKNHQTSVLICGAISGCLANAIEVAGIRVIPYVTGDVDTIVKAFERGNLDNCRMPGCLQKGRRGRRRGHRKGRLLD